MVSPPAQVMKQGDETIVGSTAMGRACAEARPSSSPPRRIQLIVEVRTPLRRLSCGQPASTGHEAGR